MAHRARQQRRAPQASGLLRQAGAIDVEERHPNKRGRVERRPQGDPGAAPLYLLQGGGSDAGVLGKFAHGPPPRDSRLPDLSAKQLGRLVNRRRVGVLVLGHLYQ
jgi:hypothetical protein